MVFGCLNCPLAGSTCRRTIQHSLDTNILIYIRPVDPLAVTKNFKVLPLLG